MATILTGDSILSHMNDFISPFIQLVCQRGAYIEDVFPLLLKNNVMTHAKSTIIHIGTNNINSDHSIRSCMEKIDMLCRDIKSINKNCCLYFSSVLLRGDNLHDSERCPARIYYLNCMIDKFNQQLSSYCFFQGHTFIDHAPYFTVDNLTRDNWYPYCNG